MHPFYTEDPTTYLMNMVVLDTGSINMRPPADFLDYMVNDHRLVGVSASIVLERCISYAADIPLLTVMKRDTQKRYLRLKNRTVPEALDALAVDHGYPFFRDYWKRRVIDLHRNSSYQDFPGVLLFGLDGLEIRKLYTAGAKVLRIDPPADTPFSIRSGDGFDARMDFQDVAAFTQRVKLAVSSVLNSPKMFDMRILYQEETEYAVEMAELHAALASTHEESSNA